MQVFHKMGKNGVIENVPKKNDSDNDSISGKDEEEKQGSAIDGQSFTVTETSYVTKSRCTEKSSIVKVKQVKHQLLEGNDKLQQKLSEVTGSSHNEAINQLNHMFSASKNSQDDAVKSPVRMNSSEIFDLVALKQKNDNSKRIESEIIKKSDIYK